MCNINECEKTHYALGYCRNHYTAYKRYGNPLGAFADYKQTNCEKHPRQVLNTKGNCQTCYQIAWKRRSRQSV